MHALLSYQSVWSNKLSVFGRSQWLTCCTDTVNVQVGRNYKRKLNNNKKKIYFSFYFIVFFLSNAKHYNPQPGKCRERAFYVDAHLPSSFRQPPAWTVNTRKGPSGSGAVRNIRPWLLNINSYGGGSSSVCGGFGSDRRLDQTRNLQVSHYRRQWMSVVVDLTVRIVCQCVFFGDSIWQQLLSGSTQLLFS